MKIRIICVGRMKEKWLKEGLAEYSKRLSRFCQLQLEEVPDAPESLSVSKALLEEAERVQARLKEQEAVYLLDLWGKEMQSEELSDWLMEKLQRHGASLTFVIGGSHGFHPSLRQRAQAGLCLSKLTFPHQLCRLLLLEQLFRAFKIQAGENYHK